MKSKIIRWQRRLVGGRLIILFFACLTIACGRQKSPTKPGDNPYQIVGQQSTPGYGLDVSVVEGYAYLADDQAGVRIIDVSDPHHPQEVGVVGLEEGAIAVEALFAMGEIDLLLVADGGIGVLIYDIGDRVHPHFLSNAFDRDMVDVYGLEDRDTLFVIAVDEEEGNLKMNRYERQSDSLWNWHTYTHFLRIAFPYGRPRGVVAGGNFAYMANDHIGLEIVDLTLPEDSAWVGSLNTSGGTRDLCLASGLVFIAAYQSGLQIVDVSDPRAPRLVGSYEKLDRVVDVSVVNGLAYLADRDVGLEVLDISDPSHPVSIGGVETPYAQEVHATEEYVYVADRDWGLVIIEKQ